LSTPLISVLLPTRGRPALARRFLESLLATAHEPAMIESVLYVDDDDQTAGAIGELPGNVRRITGPRLGMGAANTACLSQATGDILLLANDDIVVRTEGWDTHVRTCDARFADGIYLAWPNDGFASYRISTFPILTRRTCELLAQPYPAAYRKAFIDTDLLDIFMRLERRGHPRLSYLDHVVFEHRHHRLGKRSVDETSNVRLRFVDDAMFLARIPVRQQQAERLAAACERQPVVPAPADVVPPSISRNPLRAFARFARAFLTDPGLRPRRRLYLFVWYCGRYIAARALRVPV
jgi:glycosyltransferase involved in cell wall biosynthesis